MLGLSRFAFKDYSCVIGQKRPEKALRAYIATAHTPRFAVANVVVNYQLNQNIDDTGLISDEENLFMEN